MRLGQKILIIAVGVILIFSLLGITILYLGEKKKQALNRKEDEKEQTARMAEAMPQTPPPGTARETPVKMYFRAPEHSGGPLGLLKPEVRQVAVSADKAVFLRRILDVLIGGPNTGGYATVPAGTTVRQAFVVDDLAVVDFSGEISTHHPGGVLEELATIYSVVNSVTENVPGIRRVRILVEGTENPTLAGHISLARTLFDTPQYVVGWKADADIIHEENLK